MNQSTSLLSLLIYRPPLLNKIISFFQIKYYTDLNLDFNTVKTQYLSNKQSLPFLPLISAFFSPPLQPSSVPPSCAALRASFVSPPSVAPPAAGPCVLAPGAESHGPLNGPNAVC